MENSPKLYDIYVKKKIDECPQTENNPGHSCDTINNKLGEK